MGLLRVLGLGFVMAWFFRAEMAGETVGNLGPRRADGAVVHLHAVGSHIGDRARLIQRLRHPHRVAGGETQLARGLLLQGGGGERRRRVTPLGAGIDVLDAKSPLLHRRLGARGNARLAEAQLLQLLPLKLHQTRGKRGAVMLHLGDDLPIFLRFKNLDLALSLDDQAEGHRLHPPRRFRAGQLAPQHRRQRKAEQIIQRPAGQIGVDQVLIQLSRGLHRGGDGLLGDRVEGDARHRLWQRLLLGEVLAHMPADRLALAVRVGGQDQAVGLFRRIDDRLHAGALVSVQLPIHGKAFVGAHRSILGRQVADVAIGGQHLETGPEIFLDGLRLGGGFYDDKLHGLVKFPYVYTCTRGWSADDVASRAREVHPPTLRASMRQANTSARWSLSGPERSA